MDSAKFGNEAHFMSFAAFIATRNGTEGSNFHIRNTMTAIVEVSGNRLVCIVACDTATVLAKPSPQTSSSFSNVKHASKPDLCKASLIYAAIATRPDIAQAVGTLAKFNLSPNEAHLTAFKRVFRYLKGTVKLHLQ